MEKRIEDIAEVVNKHSGTITKIAARVNSLTKENESLRNRVNALEKEMLTLRLMLQKVNSNPFGNLF